jgi:hypothetical protein
MASVTFPVDLGGDGSTVTDDRDPSTGLRGGGYRTRFVPALQQTVAVLNGGIDAATDAGAAQVALAAAQVALAVSAAQTAVNAPGTSATSTTSVAIGTGSKSFTTQTGKNFVAGMRVNIASTAAPTVNAMYGIISSYNSGTGALVVVVDAVIGSGTIADWTISLSGLTGVVTGAGFTPTLNTTSPNGTVSVAYLLATGAQTNIDMALAPKGTGAVLADLPDSTATGGNKRGTNAVDFQTVRAAAAQVASGQSAVLVGGENNTASGIRSAVLGGILGTTRGITGAEAWGNGATTAGDFQREHHTQIAVTASSPASPWVLVSSVGGFPDSSNIMVMPNNSTYKLQGQVVARQYGGSSGTVGDSATWNFSGTFTRGANAASTAVLDSVTVTKEADSAGATAWTLTLTADTTLGGPVLTFTGAANKNIGVVAEIRTVEETF